MFIFKISNLILKLIFMLSLEFFDLLFKVSNLLQQILSLGRTILF